MKYALSIIVVIFIISCSTQQHNSNEEYEYIIAYKKSVLYGCIDAGTQDKFKEFMRDNNDLGLFTEVSVLMHQITEEARKKGAKHAAILQPINYADGEGRLPIFSDCVSYAFGKEIDSIAKVEYKKYKSQ